MLFEPLEPHERFRARREAARRRRRRRRMVLIALPLAALASVALGSKTITGNEGRGQAEPAATVAATKPKPAVLPQPRALPDEVRGVHVTMALASLDGKLDEYVALRDEGLNAIQLDVKDENGEIGFVPSAVPLAGKIGAARPYYKPREVARMMHSKGIYLIGRVVVFEDPVLSANAPHLAVKRRDGSLWRNHAGLGWSNPHDKRVWDYNVAIAEVAARAGFDEIQFDYVRFPSDGDMDDIVYPRSSGKQKGWAIAEFVQYAAKRLKPLGVRVSADVFGLAATRELGVGQVPKRLGRYVDAMYPMVYPSHYNPGEYNLDNPNAAPAETVYYALVDFKRDLRRSKAELIPWLQDFSYGRTYGPAEVRAQIEAARRIGVRGYLLWNPEGVYTPGALRPASARG
jgi:hypothetical protein